MKIIKAHPKKKNGGINANKYEDRDWKHANVNWQSKPGPKNRANKTRYKNFHGKKGMKHGRMIEMGLNSMNLSSERNDIKLKGHSYLERRLLDILKNGPVIRDDLVEILGIPRTTVYDALKRLIIRAEVKKYPEILEEEHGRGRPKVLFALVGDD